MTTLTRIIIFLCLILNTNLFGQSIKPHTIGIVVNDINKSTKWYENVLDIKLYKEMSFPEYDSLKINFLKGNDFQLEIMEKKTSFTITSLVPDYSINKKPLIGFSKVAFTVPNITKVFEKIKKLNVQIILPITEDKEFNSKYFIIKDLDENILQFIEQKSE